MHFERPNAQKNPEKRKVKKKYVCLPYLKFSDPLPETHLFFYLVYAFTYHMFTYLFLYLPYSCFTYLLSHKKRVFNSISVPKHRPVIPDTWKRSGSVERVLSLRPRGCGFEPHRHHCVVVLEQDIYPSLVLVQPRKTRPCLTERLLVGRKESKQIKQNPDT